VHTQWEITMVTGDLPDTFSYRRYDLYSEVYICHEQSSGIEPVDGESITGSSTKPVSDECTRSKHRSSSRKVQFSQLTLASCCLIKSFPSVLSTNNALWQIYV
jgi:hypothetical protein